MHAGEMRENGADAHQDELYPSRLMRLDVPETVFLDVLRRTVGVLEQSGLPHAFMGGVASAAMGRPRYTHDIDLFMRKEDAGAALDAFAASGFHTERTNPNWLYKAERDGVIVDLIFEVKDGTHFDEGLAARVRRADFHGIAIPVLAPEDLLLTKIAAFSEDVPRHWWDAQSLVSSEGFDWDHLIQRARSRPHLVLGVLASARAEGVQVPDTALRELTEAVIGLPDAGREAGSQRIAQIREQLAVHPDVAETDLQITCDDGRVAVAGMLPSRQRRDAVARAIDSLLQPGGWEDRLQVLEPRPAGQTEAL